jgi:hypothetical protein
MGLFLKEQETICRLGRFEPLYGGDFGFSGQLAHPSEPPTTMQSPSQLIKIGSGKDKTLSKEQKRFNNYINKLKKLREEIEKLEAFNREIPVRLQRELSPLDRKKSGCARN